MVPGIAERERAPLREQWVDWVHGAALSHPAPPLFRVGHMRHAHPGQPHIVRGYPWRILQAALSRLQPPQRLNDPRYGAGFDVSH